jgi:hypothetical protein
MHSGFDRRLGQTVGRQGHGSAADRKLGQVRGGTFEILGQIAASRTDRTQIAAGGCEVAGLPRRAGAIRSLSALLSGAGATRRGLSTIRRGARLPGTRNKQRRDVKDVLTES